MREDIKLYGCAARFSNQLVQVLESIYDPEIELDIYNLGLIYEILVDDIGFCKVTMTFTDSSCSCADTLPNELVTALKTIDVITDAQVEIVWSPVWKMTRISRLGRITLGISPK